MTIQTSFPSDNFVPGVGGEFDFVTGARSSPTSDLRMLVIGTRRSTGTVTAEKLVQCFDESSGDEQFGIGSEVALMVRAAIRASRDVGQQQPEIWAVGIDEPGGGTAATGTFTITGPATASGEVIVRIAGREIRCAVANGDAQNTIATNLSATINEKQLELPVLASVATNVVTVTYRHKGTNGNDVKIDVANSKDGRPALPAGVTATASAAALATGAGVIDITNALDKGKVLDFWSIAISNNETADLTDLDANLDETWATMTDRYRFAVCADINSLAAAQTLASTANDYRIAIGCYPGARSLPCEVSAVLACLMVCRERPNFNHCGTEVSLFGPDLDAALTPAEQNTAIKSGLTAFLPLPSGKSKLIRFVTTHTTQGGVTFRATMDIGVPFTTARIAREIDDMITLSLQERNLDEALLLDLKALALNHLRFRERSGWVANVDEHADEVRCERHPTNVTRVLLEIPEEVVPIAAQAVIKNRLLQPTS